MWDRYDKGASVFSRGQQNQPIKEGTTVYNITSQLILAKTTDRTAGEVPSTVEKVVAGIDINYSFGLTWGVAGFGSGLANVIDYGRYNMSLTRDIPEQELARLVYESVIELGRQLADKPYPIHLAVFDIRGWNYDSAYNLSAQGSRACGIPLIGAMGHGASQYRTPHKKQGRRRIGNYWHEYSDEQRRERLMYCSDFWREIAQRSWLGSFGSPGSIDLPKGHHKDFADQICREPLLAKMDTPLGVRWQYKPDPSNSHDFGDVMHMIFMGADYLGMGTGGTAIQQRPQRKRYTQSQLSGGR
jgi:hypothetical protein